jgi:CheY-like chemotaxis protein
MVGYRIRPTILIVEDEAADERLVLRALERGFGRMTIRVAKDAEEASRILFEEGYQADLVLLDLHLPGMTGLELLERIRSFPTTMAVPVVVLSGSDNPMDIQRSYAAGAYGFVRKSTDPSQFMEKMYLITRYWFHANCVPSQSYAAAVGVS